MFRSAGADLSVRPESSTPTTGCANRRRPVSSRQAVQRPSAASAKISAPHFGQTSNFTDLPASEALLNFTRLAATTTAAQRSNDATHLRSRWYLRRWSRSFLVTKLDNDDENGGMLARA